MVESTVACVYFLVSSKDPDVVRYVGISRADTPERRFARHLVLSRGKSHLPVHSWIRRHVADGHTIFPVAFRTHITRDEACRLEHNLVVGLRDTGRLLNLTDGGDGSIGWKHSEESRAKISASLKGRPGVPLTDEAKAKISAANRGNKYSVGRVVSEETRARQRATWAAKLSVHR